MLQGLGDLLLYYAVDAILGALGLLDIGQIFSDSDPRWKINLYSLARCMFSKIYNYCDAFWEKTIIDM
ncbi:hypothetical protein GUJ93_ZPchr0008g11783 [Zizania palustris]|uniref:2-C-methyl-D-erythritol 2,4-cyclodiphosphate synthase domain-containing protein n=1 Tax=Zizania palustris TaxID=103762 RepID=A0A8J5RXP8_ZIZPA|nr:hypothetical protein GUJ93_ZPchr0008g11783 [Zizania palustris]